MKSVSSSLLSFYRMYIFIHFISFPVATILSRFLASCQGGTSYYCFHSTSLPLLQFGWQLLAMSFTTHHHQPRGQEVQRNFALNLMCISNPTISRRISTQTKPHHSSRKEVIHGHVFKVNVCFGFAGSQTLGAARQRLLKVLDIQCT